jgi:hypothetical protein
LNPGLSALGLSLRLETDTDAMLPCEAETADKALHTEEIKRNVNDV